MLTVGVEEELLVVDRNTGTPAPAAEDLVKGLDVGAAGAVAVELTRPQFETNSRACTSLTDLRRNLLDLRAAAVREAARRDQVLIAAGVSPLGQPVQPLTQQERYQRIAASFGQLAREQSVCGCHVHVEVPDRERGIAIINHLRPWLPTLLALTANSRVAHGGDTEYASWRWLVWSRWPSAGSPPYFPDAASYEATVEMLLAAGAALDRKMLYWDVRMSEHLPTLEVRVSDSAATVDEAVLLAGLARGLVTTALDAVDRGESAPAVGPAELRVAMWRAAKDGLEGVAYDPVRGTALPAREQLRRLRGHVDDALREHGDADAVDDLVAGLLRRGSGAARQLGAWSRRWDGRDVLDLLVEQTAAEDGLRSARVDPP